MSVLKASSSISSPSWKSIARLALPSRLELNSPEGSLCVAMMPLVVLLGSTRKAAAGPQAQAAHALD
jgi:hypothetical protein